MKKILRNNRIFGVVIAVIIMFIIMFCSYKKEYLYQDEVLSYTLANDADGGRIDTTSGRWTSSDELIQYITVSSDERFDYKTTIINQTKDSHPPIYALILKTICSFFPGKFSKWYGLSINIVSIVIVLWIYYKLLNNMVDKELSMYITALYGLSIAVINQVTFIRMYVVVQIFTTLCAYIHIKMIQDSDSRDANIKLYISIFFVTVLGVLTHYYYLIFAFFISFFTCLYLLFKKKIKKIVIYIVSMVISIFFVLILYKPIILSIFTDEESIFSETSGYELGSIRFRISTMLNFIGEELMGGLHKPIIIIIIIYGVYYICSKKKVISIIKDIKIEYYLLIFTSSLYFIVISLVSPYLCDRHIFPIFNLVFFIVISVLLQISDEIFKSKQLGRVVLFVLGLLPLFLHLKAGITDVNTPLRRQIAAENSNRPCIFYNEIAAEENIFDLMQYDQVYFYDFKSDMDDKITNSDTELVVYVPDWINEDIIFSKIREYRPDLVYDERLYVASYSTVYKLYN